jgi:hypothetical protein
MLRPVRIVLSIIALCAIGIAHDTKSDSGLRITGLRASYTERDNLRFKVGNSSTADVFINATIEGQICGEWRELDYSVVPRNRASKTILLKRIVPNQALAFSYSLNRHPGTTIFRLRVDWYDRGVKTGQIYSQPFKLPRRKVESKNCSEESQAR